MIVMMSAISKDKIIRMCRPWKARDTKIR